MLLDAFAHKCVLMEKTRNPDGEGGFLTTWTDGVEFDNYQAMDSSMQARRAEQEGVTSVFSALVAKDVPIEFGDYYKDVETGVTYRVTSNPVEKEAPKSASLAIKALKFFTVERRELPR